MERLHYVEPYAGGCGLALRLLYEGHVADIHINDIDLSVWAFWKSVLDHPKELASLIRETPVTITEWHAQKEIHASMRADDPVALGFSAFFLNRTNRSGIISKAGVIGGLDQTGPYKIDCRFNRGDLERRIKRIAKYRNRIHLSRYDALAFIQKTSANLPATAFYCIDPPYFAKGKALYTNAYDPEDHATLADEILKLNNPWTVTYDNAPVISKLYKNRRQYEFYISYSLQEKRKGTELLIASKGLRLPAEIRARQVNRPRP